MTPLLHKIVKKAFQSHVHSPGIFGFDFRKQEAASGLLI